MKTYNSDKEFVVGSHNIGWVDSDFKTRFKDVQFEERKLGTFQKLPRNMTDKEIESELKPGICTLGDVFAFIENPPEGTKDSYSNIFYTESFVVGVIWGGSLWGVRTWDRRELDWDAGTRVFSPATVSSSLTPCSEILGPSGLELALKIVKEAGYTVVKIV